MTLSIKIENFEGPFDLLLHLIKQNKMNIYDIKINEITGQYLEYIQSMKRMDLEITSEFIVMAATLLEIKSKLLLPKVKSEEAADLDELDFEKELVSKLLEYNKIKLAAEILKDRQQGTMYSKKPEIIKDIEYDEKELLKDVTILELYAVYMKLIYMYKSKLNTENDMQRKISIDTYKIEDKIKELEDILSERPKIFFSDITVSCQSKAEVVVTFLALLELIRLRYINVVQQGNFKDMHIERVNIYERS